VPTSGADALEYFRAGAAHRLDGSAEDIQLGEDCVQLYTPARTSGEVCVGIRRVENYPTQIAVL